MIKSLSMVLFLLCLFAFSPANAEKGRFSFSSLTGTQSPLWVAKEVGFFKKHNIDADLVYIPGGSVDVQALLSGELQMGISGPGAVIRSNLTGADFVYVAVGSNKLDFVLVTAKNITDLKQMRGKRVGVGRFGGGPDYTFRIVLEKLGLKPDKDIFLSQIELRSTVSRVSFRRG